MFKSGAKFHVAHKAARAAEGGARTVSQQYTPIYALVCTFIIVTIINYYVPGVGFFSRAKGGSSAVGAPYNICKQHKHINEMGVCVCVRESEGLGVCLGGVYDGNWCPLFRNCVELFGGGGVQRWQAFWEDFAGGFHNLMGFRKICT